MKLYSLLYKLIDACMASDIYSSHHIQDNIMASDRRNVEWNDSSKIWIWIRCVTNLNGFFFFFFWRSFGFDEKWIHLGFQCVSTTFFSVVINGAGSQSLNVSLNLQCRLRQEKVFDIPGIWDISLTDMWVSYVERT